MSSATRRAIIQFSRNYKLQKRFLSSVQNVINGRNIILLNTVCKRWQSHSSSPITAINKNKATNIERVSIDSNKKCIEVTWDDYETSIFPFVWARDNCQCKSCFDPASKSRTMLLNDLDINVQPLSVELTEDRRKIKINWKDGHLTVLKSDWMKNRSFNEDSQADRNIYSSIDKIHWESKDFSSIPRIKFDHILSSDDALLEWCTSLEAYGLVLITEAPAKYGMVKKLADRMAFIRKTHYGEEFSVKAKADPNNVAYSSGPLQLHADLPYYKYKPGTQLIHCIVQYAGEGGDSLVCDAENVANHLRKENNVFYQTLCNTKVDWCDIGEENGNKFYKKLQQPVINTDENGKICRINFSQPQRDSFFNISVSKVPLWYAAYKHFYNMLSNPKFCVKFKMSEGVIQSFDNLRIVHGRTAYEVGKGSREIEGCYIDWDEVKSRRNILEARRSAV